MSLGLAEAMEAAQAAARGDASALRAMLQSGMGPDDAIVSGVTPLFLAANEGGAECAALLLSAGANPNFKRLPSGAGPLARGAASSWDNEGLTPLMAAASAGRSDVCDALLAAGADVSAIDASGKSVGDWARMGFMATWPRAWTRWLWPPGWARSWAPPRARGAPDFEPRFEPRRGVALATRPGLQ